MYYEEEEEEGENGEESTGPSPVTSLVPILRSHDGKVQRIAIHPVLPSIFATTSADKTVRLWNCSVHLLQQISFFKLNDASTCICFSHDGLHLAIGNDSGELCVYETDLLTTLINGTITIDSLANGDGLATSHNWILIYRRNIIAKTGAAAAVVQVGGVPVGSDGSRGSKKKNRKHEVTELRYSGCGNYLALGCKDNLIHVLSVHQHYRHAAVCRGHSSFIRSIDFSLDCRIIQAADAARELLYWDTSTGHQVTHAADFKDEEWSTWSAIYGWPVQGVLNGDMSKAVVNGADNGSPSHSHITSNTSHSSHTDKGHNSQRSVPVHSMPSYSLDGEINCVSRSPDGALLVAGGSHTVNKAIKLFNYPCLAHCSPSLHGGHTSPVLDVAFTRYDASKAKVKDSSGDDRNRAHVISVGGNDCCVFVWNVVPMD